MALKLWPLKVPVSIVVPVNLSTSSTYNLMVELAKRRGVVPDGTLKLTLTSPFCVELFHVWAAEKSFALDARVTRESAATLSAKTSLTDKLPSEAVTVTLKLPDAVGVPLKVLVAALNVNPAGRPETEKVRFELSKSPKVVVGITKVNAVFCEADISTIALVTVGASLAPVTLTVNLAVLERPPASLTV